MWRTNSIKPNKNMYNITRCVLTILLLLNLIGFCANPVYSAPAVNCKKGPVGETLPIPSLPPNPQSETAQADVKIYDQQEQLQTITDITKHSTATIINQHLYPMRTPHFFLDLFRFVLDLRQKFHDRSKSLPDIQVLSEQIASISQSISDGFSLLKDEISQSKVLNLKTEYDLKIQILELEYKNQIARNHQKIADLQAQINNFTVIINNQNKGSANNQKKKTKTSQSFEDRVKAFFETLVSWLTFVGALVSLILLLLALCVPIILWLRAVLRRYQVLNQFSLVPLEMKFPWTN